MAPLPLLSKLIAWFSQNQFRTRDAYNVSIPVPTLNVGGSAVCHCCCCASVQKIDKSDDLCGFEL